MNAMTNTVTCLPVPKEVVDTVWHDVAPILERAVATSRGRCEISDIRDGIDSGLYLLWIILIDGRLVAALTTRIIDYPRCKAMALDWIGGRRMKDWIKVANDAMVLHAKHNGCSHMEGYGRAAWIRWNGKYGWKEDYVSFRMELNDDKLPVQPV